MKYLFLIFTIFLSGCGFFDFSLTEMMGQSPTASNKNVDTIINTDISETLESNSKYQIIVVKNPDHGLVTIHNGQFKYIPNPGFVGVDSFSYKILDTETNQESQVAIVTINVKSVNTKPVILDQSFVTNEDTSLLDILSFVDNENDTVTFTVLTNPSHGSFNFVNPNVGSFIYSPVSNYNGTDEVIVSVSDGFLSSTAKITIIVTPVDDPIIVKDLAYTMNEGDLLTGQLEALNPDGKPFTYVLTQSISPSIAYFDKYSYDLGSHEFSQSGEFRVRGNNNAYGTLSFKYQAFDGTSYSNEATVTVTILNLPSSPFASNCGASVNKGSMVSFGGSSALYDFDCGDDTDPTGKTTLTYIIASQPAHGSVTLTNGGRTFQYQSDGVYFGVDTFEYYVFDGSLTSATKGTGSVNVINTNSAPIANTLGFSIKNNLTYNGQLTATDADGDALNYHLGTSTSHGTLSLNVDGSFTYTPTSSYEGSDSFTFTVNDGTVASSSQTVSITVLSAIPSGNTIPALTDLTLYVVNKDCSAGCSSANKFIETDSDNDPLTYSVTTPSAHFADTQFELNGSSYRLNLTYNYSASWPFPQNDSISYKRNDGYQDSNISKINLKYLPHITSLKLGDKVTCILAKNENNFDNLYCWGDNSSGQLGTGNKTSQLKPVKVLENVYDFGIGKTHMCAIADPDSLGAAIWCWGANNLGQLGDGSTTESLVPKKSFTTTSLKADSWMNPSYKAIAVGYDHNCVILQGSTDSGQVWCWGSNQKKQFTPTFDTNRKTPEKVVQSGAVKIQAGHNHTCYIDSSKNLVCWGNSTYGQIGDGDYSHVNRNAPSTVMSSVQDITLANQYTCATNTSNDLYCWGWNAGTSSSISYPNLVGSVSSTDSLEMYDSSYCVASYGMATTCWGSNSHGQLGAPLSTLSLESFIDGFNPWATFLENDTYIPKVASGTSHSCAYKQLSWNALMWAPAAGVGATGALYCWGDNSKGQLGNGTQNSSVGAPVEVSF